VRPPKKLDLLKKAAEEKVREEEKGRKGGNDVALRFA
jgi:hypothetical protein